MRVAALGGRTLIGAAGSLVASATAAAQAPGSVFEPASPQAREIAGLFGLILAASVLVFLAVCGVLAYCLLRFRAQPGARAPAQVQGNMRLELGWTAAPAVVLAVVVALEVPGIFGAGAAPADALTVLATGNRFWWAFEFPSLGIVTANELHIPVGAPVRVQLRSTDVIHSFWVPRLNGKTDLIPGQTNELVLHAEQPDTYVGQCAEFCGLQHAWMLLRVIAEPPAQFDDWVARERAPAAAPASDTARQGEQLFATHACGNCHAIQGTSAAGRAGPDLTHVASRETLGAGALPSSAVNLRRWVSNPQQFKPGAFMPTFRLADSDLAALGAYLDGLR